MKILLTNDDGVEAEGLLSLAQELQGNHEVLIVAPDGQRSGMSHAVTLHNPVSITEISPSIYSCSGTPADCVLYALLGAVRFIPDIVISGINHGPNIGTDIIYSGTVAGARQAALMNYPGVAVSLVAIEEPYDFSPTSRFIAANLETFAGEWTGEMFFNVNVPQRLISGAEAKIGRPALRIYNDELHGEDAGDGSTTWSLRGALNSASIEAGTDWEAVENGHISVSPVNVHPLNHSSKESYHLIEFERVERF